MPIQNQVIEGADAGGGSWTWDAPGSGSSSGNQTNNLYVKYFANGATGNPPSQSSSNYSGPNKYLILKVKVKSPGSSMSKAGYKFIGWNTNSSATKSQYNPGDELTQTWNSGASGTITKNLYAIWAQSDQFIYRPDEYANEQGFDKYGPKPLNQETTLSEALFTRDGYTQTGWKLEDGTHAGDVGGSYTATTAGDLVLYPEWTGNTYTLTFKPNGEEGSDIVKTVVYGSTVDIPPSFTYSKDNYHIDNWNENANGMDIAWYPGIKYTFQRTTDLTLYAIWAGNEYYVVYDTDPENPVSEIDTFINYSKLKVDENNYIYSDSEDFPLFLDSNNNLYTSASSLEVDQSLSGKHSIATYGSVFYTDYTPEHKENVKFSGWKRSSGESLVKTDYCLDSYSLSSSGIWNLTQNVILKPIWSDEFFYNRLFFGRKESLDYGLVIEEYPDYHWPAREYTANKIKGRNGDVLSDPNRYENVKKIYKIAAYDGNGFRSIAPKVSAFLHRYNGYSGYIRLEDDYEPDVYMMAVYEESNSFTNLLNQAGRTEISFNCKPQKYLRSGDMRVDIINSGFIINNPTDHPALPIIKILGAGHITIKSYPDRRLLGGVNQSDSGSAELKTVDLYIHNNFNEIVLDSESFTATDINGRNMNPYITLMERIALYPGANTIEYEGDIIKISIIPKWWRL